MPRIEESIEIRQPVNKVFTYTTDPMNWPKWQPFPKAEQTSPGPMAVGSTTRGTIHMMGLTMKWTAVVTELEPDRKFGKTIESGPITIQERNTYDSLGEGTSFTIVYDINLGAVMKPISPVFTRAMRRSLDMALHKLKGNLEASI